MNPLFQEALGAILRHFLTGAAAYLVARGIWSETEAQQYVAAAVLGLIGLGWTFWQKYKMRSKFLAALVSEPGLTENQVEALAKNGEHPPLGLMKTEVPFHPNDWEHAKSELPPLPPPGGTV
jgi:hypothetical protein